MDKKLSSLLTAVVLTLALAGNALAAFGNLELIRVVLQQNGGTTEIATDLGTVSSVLAGGIFGGGANAFTAQTGGTNFVAGTTGLNVVYFAVNQSTKELWITGLSPSIYAGKSGTITSLTTNMFNYYNTFGGTTILADASYPNSYRVKADATTQFGQFGTAILITARPYTEANLAPLATTGGSVTQNLYHFVNYGTASAGVAVATITTNSDGSTTISPLSATDSTPPNVTITSASQLTSTSSTVNVAFTATDAVGVTGYLLNESSVSPPAGTWTAITSSTNYGGSASYTFSNLGSGASSTRTVYVWAKDAAGNVSSIPATQPQNVQVTIQKPAYNPNPNIIAPADPYYFYMSNAFAAATNGDSIRTMSTTIIENTPTFDRPAVTVTVNGGYDALPSGNITGVTTIQGPLYIKNGRLNVTGVAIKQP